MGSILERDSEKQLARQSEELRRERGCRREPVCHRPVSLMSAGLISICLIIAGLLLGCRSGGSRSSADDKSPVIAEINGEAVHAAAFDRFVKARLSDFASSQIDLDQQRSNLLDEFLQRQVVVREAINKNIELTDEEMSRTLESQYKQTTTEGGDQNPAVLQSGERRIEIVNDLLTLKLYQKEVLGNVQITPQEIETDYAAHRAQYEGRNGFYVREVRVHEEAEAQKIYRQALAKPDDFAVLAKEYSDAPTAARGGLIYYLSLIHI